MNNTEDLNQWLSHIYTYRIPVFRQLKSFIDFVGIGAELGAGSCWFSSLLSRSDRITNITVIDINKDRLDLAKSFFIPKFKGNIEKIKFHTGDFHDRLPLKEGSLDFIICDASLHHATNLPRLLSQAKQLLKPQGVLAAIREPVLPEFPPLKMWRKLTFGLTQRLHGDIEKIYTKDEWNSYFSEAGFSLEFHEYFLNYPLKEKIVKYLKKWNGTLFNRCFFIARPHY